MVWMRMGWDKIFNCERCGKKLWTSYHKLPDGKTVCGECYNFHLLQVLDKINDNKAYEIVYNFVEKYQGNFPVDLVQELAKLLGIKYKITIDSATLHEVLKIIREKIEKENSLVKLAKLERDLKRDSGQDFYCEVCNVKMPKSEYEYSMNNFGKPLCLHHQREKRAAPHALKLYESLRKRGVFCELESYNSSKHIDIALIKDEESFKEGFATKRFSLKEIDEHMEGIAETLTEVIKQRIKKIQQASFLPKNEVNDF
jgi:hypothetical protein